MLTSFDLPKTVKSRERRYYASRSNVSLIFELIKVDIDAHQRRLRWLKFEQQEIHNPFAHVSWINAPETYEITQTPARQYVALSFEIYTTIMYAI